MPDKYRGKNLYQSHLPILSIRNDKVTVFILTTEILLYALEILYILISWVSLDL